MVKTISKHICELCGAAHTTLERAEACEALGVPVSVFAVGDYAVAPGKVYGWWGADKSWSLTTDRNAEKDDHLGPGNMGKGKDYKPAWRQDPGGGGETAPGLKWFLELWRVVDVRMAPAGGWSDKLEHRLEFILWNPRHPNVVKGTERIVRTYTSGHMTIIKPPVLDFSPPAITSKEEARFSQLVAMGGKVEAVLL